MLTIDQIGIIAYALTVANVVSLVMAFTYMFSVHIKAGALSWLLILIYLVLGVYGLQMITGLWNRYMMIVHDSPASAVSVPWAVEQFFLSICLTGISILFWTRNTDRFIETKSRKGE